MATLADVCADPNTFIDVDALGLELRCGVPAAEIEWLSEDAITVYGSVTFDADQSYGDYFDTVTDILGDYDRLSVTDDPVFHRHTGEVRRPDDHVPSSWYRATGRRSYPDADGHGDVSVGMSAAKVYDRYEFHKPVTSIQDLREELGVLADVDPGAVRVSDELRSLGPGEVAERRFRSARASRSVSD